MPEDGYGWEKLFSERMCRHFMEDYGISVRVPRFHNVYGPHGTYARRPREGAGRDLPQGDRRRSSTGPARSRSGATASRRAASRTSTTRSTGIFRIMESGRHGADQPRLAPSSSRSTSSSTSSRSIAGVKLERSYDLDAPQGVRGRNSDNTLILEQLGWEPSTSLEDGLERTYDWIYEQMTSGVRDEARGDLQLIRELRAARPRPDKISTCEISGKRPSGWSTGPLCWSASWRRPIPTS